MNQVIIYSTTICPHCNDVKKFLDKNNISYIEKDISKNRNYIAEMKSKSGQMSVPVVDINGNIIVGYDEVEMVNHLEL